jgi:hypothetical protein
MASRTGLRLLITTFLCTLTAASLRAAPAPQAMPADPALELLRSTVRQAQEYVEEYMPALGTLIMHESYVQNALRGGEQIRGRQLTAELVLVFVPSSRQWRGFRDVVEVDGKPRHDRQKRLRQLFASGHPVVPARLSNESARFNIGPFKRTVNLPTLALQFLDRSVAGGLSFTLKGETSLDGTRALEVLFREEARPTQVRTYSGKDVPAEGSFWIELGTGRVLKTRLWLTEERSSAELTVTYEADEALGLLVPSSMRELYVAPAVPPLEMECQARYSRFERATAVTSETYQLPRWGEPAR